MSPGQAPLDTRKVGEVTVTMASIPDLRHEAERLTQEAAATRAGAEKLRADAVTMFVEAGLLLVARSKEWAPANPAAAGQLEQANELIRKMDEEGIAVEGQGKKGRGLFGLRKAPSESPEQREARESRNGQLRLVLSELGRGFGGAHPAVAAGSTRAAGLEKQASADLERADRMRADAAQLTAEASAREQTVAEMGFDILFAAAQLQASGPQPGKSTMALRPGETLVFVQPADLGRQRSMATPERAEQGLPFPVEKTGIPYRLGRYVGQLVKQDDVAKLGNGQVVITNQRMGFEGSVKSFSFPLGSLQWVTQYKDGLVFLREGRENADVLLTPSAGEVLFHLNYALLLAG